MPEQRAVEMQSGRLVITTVGASVFNRDKLERLYLWLPWDDSRRSLPQVTMNQHRAWLDQTLPRKLAEFRDAYIKELSKLTIDEEKDKPRRNLTNAFSAELTSIYLMRLNAEHDRIVLLLSDSPEGVFAGLIVQQALREIFSIIPELQLVNGLQTENFQDFSINGLERFADLVTGSIKKFPQHTPILNVTGGFKSLIPSATYVALGHDIPLYFSFEEQPEPVVIDPKQLPEKVREQLRPFQANLLNQPLLMKQQSLSTSHRRAEE